MTENFPVASILLPRWSRPYVRAFYDCVRRADDIADDPRLPGEVRRASLAAIDGVLAGLPEGEQVSAAPPGLASALASARVLRAALDEAGLDGAPARDLLAAFRIDTDKTRWDDWDDLMAYCRLSAVPVGRFLLNLLGGARDGGASVAALTSALQVLNHLQDVRDDYNDLGRIYLPRDILAAAGVIDEDLGADKANGSVRAALDRVLDRVDLLVDDAAGVAGDIHAARLGLEAAVILEIAKTLSAKLRREDPLAGRVELNRGEYAIAVLRGLLSGVAARWLARGVEDAAARTVHGAKSSFFWGMRLLPRDRRGALYAIYAFCRTVDDIVDDEGREEAEKHAELDIWQADIEALYRGDNNDVSAPLVRALLVPVRQFGLQRQDFLDVIAGMRTDAASCLRITDGKAFDLYCYQVAGAVGRLANPVFGITGADGDALAHALGTAMQITNILRDLREDAARNRLYLPADLLARHGIGAGVDLTPDGVEAVLTDERLGPVLDDLARRAEEGFIAADLILRRITTRRAAPVRVMMEVYHRLLIRLRERGLAASVHQPRVRVGTLERLWIAVRYGVFHGR